MPELLLLGQVTFLEGDEPHELPPGGPTWLLVILACHGGWLDRGEIAAILWPDEAESSARHSLSQLLYRSRSKPWSGLLEAEPSRIRFTGTSDVAMMQRSLAAHDWRAATEFWQGPLLGSMSGPDVHTWDDWLAAERQNLLAGFKEASIALALNLSHEGRHNDAAAPLHRALQQDPLDETLLQAYLTAARPADQHSRATGVYREFVKLLKAELDLDPLPETARLADQLAEQAGPAESRPVSAAGLQGAPASLSELVARELELAQVTGELQRPDVRLLTIVGPGGMGKTSLARQAGQLLADGYDLALFVQLAPLGSPAHFVPALASALGLELAGQIAPETLVTSYLAERQVLLVLDNFEHLLPAAGELARIMESAGRLEVLATSREPLGVRGEVVFELGGLAIPESADDPQFADYGAVRLFHLSARNSLPDLDAAALPREAVLRIIRLLDGLPLGIELAVPWLKLLSAADLASELERNLEMLQAGHGSDLPDRHRSLGAAFNHSWQLLNEAERTVLARLAVFRGSFSRTAADRVGRATLPVLLSLLNKSLLKRSPGGRFELHSPARQFAAARQADAAEVRNAHGIWLAELAAVAEVAMQGSGQREWLDRLSAQQDDFLAAIHWALESDQASLGLSIATALQPLWWLRGPYRLGADLLLSLTELDSARDSPLLARGLHRAGTLLQELGEIQRLGPLYERALELATQAADTVLMADVNHSIAYQLDRQGELDEATGRFEEAVELYRQSGFTAGESASLNSLAVLYARSGRLQDARQLFEESLRQKRELGQAQGVAYALHNLGIVHQGLGDTETYQAFMRESTELKRQIGDVPGVILAVLNQAAELLDEGDHEQAALSLAPVLEDAWRIGSFHLLLQVFVVFAGSQVAEGNLTAAARLMGGIQAQLKRLKFDTFFTDLHSAASRRLQEGLTEATFERLQLEGAALSLEQLFRLVRDALVSRQELREQEPHNA